MNLGPLLTAVALAAITGKAKATARGVRRRVAVAIATGLLFAMAAGFALAALTDWLARGLGTTGALAIVATGLVLLAFMIRGLSSLFDKRRSKPRQPPAPLADLTQALESDQHPGSEMIAMAVVAMVGFLLARQAGRG